MYQTNSSRNTKKEIILISKRKFKPKKKKKRVAFKREEEKKNKTQFLVMLVWSAAPEDNCSRERGKTQKRNARTNGLCGWHKWITLQTLLLSVERTF